MLRLIQDPDEIEKLQQLMQENGVCTFFGHPLYSLTLCEQARTGLIILIVFTALTIGLFVAAFLFRNEIRAAINRWFNKTQS